MGPFEWMGFVTCLVSLAFLVGLGLMTGLWAGIKAGTWLFGGININVGTTRIRIIQEES